MTETDERHSRSGLGRVAFALSCEQLEDIRESR
jgi:hypothetical protein